MSMEDSFETEKPIADPEKQLPLKRDVSSPTAEIKEEDPNVVGWEERDPDNPLNWTNKKKWTNGGLIAGMTFVT